MSEQQRIRGRFQPGVCPNRLGRGAPAARARAQAERDEIERKVEEAKLLRDLGRDPSHSELVLIEQLTTLIVRGRRLRQSGRGADAEMVARLVMRGMTKLGIRQGQAKPQSYADKIAEKIAAQKAAEGATEPARAGRVVVAEKRDERTVIAGSQAGGA